MRTIRIKPKHLKEIMTLFKKKMNTSMRIQNQKSQNGLAPNTGSKTTGFYSALDL